MRRVTVLVPNYNREALLPTCLKSIQAQTFTDWRAVIGDNASTDQSVEVARSFADPRMQLVLRPENVGYIRNTNLMLHDVETEFVAIIHSDDWWEPTFLSRLVELLDRTPNALFATGAARVWSGSASRVMGPHRVWPWQAGYECPSRDALRILMRRNRIVTPSLVLARRELYTRFPEFEGSLPGICDWLMWMRAATAGDLVICPEVLGNFRQHESSISGEAERLNLLGQEYVRMARILQDEWAGGHEPFPGAINELTALVTIRLVADALIRHHQGDRSGAIRLTDMAGEIAPTTRWRILAGAARRTIRHTKPSVVGGLRTSATRVGRRLVRGNKPPGKAGRKRSGPYLLGLVDDLRDDLHRDDPKLAPRASLEDIADRAERSTLEVSR